MNDRRELWGWILFLVSALLFLVAAIRDRDLLLRPGQPRLPPGMCAPFIRAHLRR